MSPFTWRCATQLKHIWLAVQTASKSHHHPGLWTWHLTLLQSGWGRGGCQVLHAKNVICYMAKEAATCQINGRGFHRMRAVELESRSGICLDRLYSPSSGRKKQNHMKVSIKIEHYKISLSRWMTDAPHLPGALWRACSCTDSPILKSSCEVLLKWRGVVLAS